MQWFLIDSLDEDEDEHAHQASSDMRKVLLAGSGYPDVEIYVNVSDDEITRDLWT